MAVWKVSKVVIDDRGKTSLWRGGAKLAQP